MIYNDEIEEIRHLADQVDRELLDDKCPDLSLLKKLIAKIDELELEKTLDRIDTLEERETNLVNITCDFNLLSETVTYLEACVKDAEKLKAAAKLLDIKLDHRVFNNLKYALENASKYYNIVENNLY